MATATMTPTRSKIPTKTRTPHPDCATQSKTVSHQDAYQNPYGDTHQHCYTDLIAHIDKYNYAVACMGNECDQWRV